MRKQDPVLLVVDDNPDVAAIISTIGVQAGFRTVTAPCSEQLPEFLAATRPDVIVLDLQMPGRDGVSTLRYLADAKIASRILLVTGMDERTIAAAEQYGRRRGLQVLETIQKPFNPAALLERLSVARAALRPLTGEDLEEAIGRGDLMVYYQPTIRRFADNTWDVAAVEALLRWNHPIRGMLTPETFIAMGEEHGISRPMTDFVIQRGVEQLRAWHASRLSIGLRVNVAASLIADLEFPDRLERILMEQSLDPHQFTLEVTETVMLEETPETYDILTRLRIKGLNLAIDDFGIGYSSLTQLMRMPFNEMKIDNSLVAKVAESHEAFLMVDALVTLAHKLNLDVCAEGVEDEKTLTLLAGLGCDSAQGYYVSVPVPAADIPEVVARWDRQQTRVVARDAG